MASSSLPVSRSHTPTPVVTPPSVKSTSCTSCGTDLTRARNAQHRIDDLEAQVKILAGKATEAVDKLADYEDELRKSQSGEITLQSEDSKHELIRASTGDGKASSPLSSILSLEGFARRPSSAPRFVSFLTTRKTSSSSSPATTGIQSQSSQPAEDLATQLTQERNLRREAEVKLSQVNSELEELSASLFQQANEMVATERQARSKLEIRAQKFEERAGKLEEKVKVLERRDKDKARRLDQLEAAIKRIERIRGMLEVG